MKTFRPATACLSLILLTGFATIAQTPEEMATAQAAEQAARKAFAEKNYAEFLSQMTIANNARPNHSRLIYNQALAYVLNGDKDKAVNLIDRLAKMGLILAVEKDPNFKALADDARLAAALSMIATNREPLNKAQKAITTDTKIAESVAFERKTGRFFLGSVHERKIVAVDRAGNARDFSRPTDELWSVLGMKVDEKRGVLWACTTAFPQMKGFAATDKGRAGIVKYDLATGKLLKKYLLPPGEDHALGDLLVDSTGNVYATDSVAPVIYKISPKSDTIEEFIRSKMFASLQGLAFDDTGKNLFVADYSKGIYRIDISTRTIVQQKPDEFITLLGIDGIYFHKGELIAIQNGVAPNRILRLSIANDQITKQQVLEANHPDFNEPTLGVLVNDSLYFIANSQWGNVNEKAELATDKIQPTKVLKLDLKK